MLELQDRVAVVTGAGSGIGKGIALALAGHGMDVVVADIESGPAEAVAAEIRSAGRSAIAVTVDVMDLDSVKALADRVLDRFGGVHVLCNNAGVSIKRRGIHASHEDWQWVLGINLWGVVHGLEAFLPGMLASGEEGHIVNTASMNGIFPSKNSALYSASKYGVVGLTETLAIELESSNIGVTALCPAGVKSRITESERNRPAHLATHVEAPAHHEMVRFELSPAREPIEVGEMVVDAIHRRALHVVTDPKVAVMIENHHREMMTAFDRLADFDRESSASSAGGAAQSSK